MSKHKSPDKDKEKSGQLVIRVDKSDRAAFIAQCEKLDTTAAREIRRFMREFIASKSANEIIEAQSGIAASQDAGAEPAAAAEPALPAPVAVAKDATVEAVPEMAAPDKKTRKRIKS